VLTGAILAGGGSTRFGGRPKGLERVGGSRIIDRVGAALRVVAPRLLIVSRDPAAAAWIAGARAVSDCYRERASIIGIHAALTHAGTDVIVVGWDMPFVSGTLLASLAAHRTADAWAVVPEGPHGPEPCCALYSSSALPRIAQCIDEGRLSLSALLEGLPGVVRVPIEEIRSLGDPVELFMNVNTPADLARAESLTG